MTSRSCKNYPDCFCYICGGIQNCRQQKVFKRLCKKRVLCIFWNKARELRQLMGSSSGLQNMRRAFETMDK